MHVADTLAHGAVGKPPARPPHTCIGTAAGSDRRKLRSVVGFGVTRSRSPVVFGIQLVLQSPLRLNVRVRAHPCGTEWSECCPERRHRDACGGHGFRARSSRGSLLGLACHKLVASGHVVDRHRSRRHACHPRLEGGPRKRIEGSGQLNSNLNRREFRTHLRRPRCRLELHQVYCRKLGLDLGHALGRLLDLCRSLCQLQRLALEDEA